MSAFICAGAGSGTVSQKVGLFAVLLLYCIIKQRTGLDTPRILTYTGFWCAAQSLCCAAASLARPKSYDSPATQGSAGFLPGPIIQRKPLRRRPKKIALRFFRHSNFKLHSQSDKNLFRSFALSPELFQLIWTTRSGRADLPRSPRETERWRKQSEYSSSRLKWHQLHRPIIQRISLNMSGQTSAIVRSYLLHKCHW